ncbi:hypothetical protein D3C71_1976050 [compost metagenome]
MVAIGRTVMPGSAMSISRKLMPCWRLPSLLVRTSANMRLAWWAWVVQIFVPLST